MAEDDGYNTQDEEITWYDKSPDYRTIDHLVADISMNGFRKLLPYNNYKNTKEFSDEIYNIRKRYRSKHYESNNEVDYDMSFTIFNMLKKLDKLNKPELSVEDINKLSRSYYIQMQILERLHTIIHGGISEYYADHYYNKFYFWIDPIVI